MPKAITTVGTFEPLTFERLEICELLAELLHCSNMSLLNRNLKDGGPEYDETGRILGGLSALEQLAHVVSSGNNDAPDVSQTSRSDDDELEPAKQLPVHGSMVDSIALSSPSLNSDDSFSGDDTDSRDSIDDGLDQDLNKETACNTPSRAAQSRRSHSLDRNTSDLSTGSGLLPNVESEPIGGHFKTELLRVGILSSLLVFHLLYFHPSTLISLRIYFFNFRGIISYTLLYMIFCIRSLSPDEQMDPKDKNWL